MLDLFGKSPLPQQLPPSMSEAVKTLRKTKNKQECLQKAYTIVTKRVYGDSWSTVTKIHRLLYPDVDHVWNNPGFRHCNHQNYLLRILLMRSGKFFDKDIQQVWTWLNVTPHQYLRVRTEKGWVNVDPWASRYGVPLGKYASNSRGRYRGE